MDTDCWVIERAPLTAAHTPRTPTGSNGIYSQKCRSLLSIRICVIVSGCIVHVSVCIQAHVPNHYVTTRYRSIHVRYIAIQRIGRPPPHLQTRYTDTLSIQYKYRAYTCIPDRALYLAALLALLRGPSATTGGSAGFLDPLLGLRLRPLGRFVRRRSAAGGRDRLLLLDLLRRRRLVGTHSLA